MRILFLCHRIPYPLDKGEKIRAFYQLRALAEQHEVDVFSLVDDPEDLLHRVELTKYCRRLVLAQIFPWSARLRSLPRLLGSMPLTVPYFYSGKLAAAIDEAVRQRVYDRIFVYCSAMAQYIPEEIGIPVIMDLVDVDSNKWRQYATRSKFPLSAIYRREARCLREYERQICEKSACVLVTTEREAELVRQLSPMIRVHVIPMGVDIRPLPEPAPDAETNAPTILFVGAMNYFPNQEAVSFFARQVLPLIRQSIPNARFLVVGRDPGRSIRELAKFPGIEVTGYVADVGPYLAQAHVSVAPFSMAAGIQSKILEALACGLPVVATPRAVQALVKDIADIIETAETAAELAAKVVYFLNDRIAAQRRGMEGRRRVTDAYGWDRPLQQLSELVEHPGRRAFGAPRLTTAPA
ncbi:MAG TPA: TIGR03087 family PEP-CTERM/XrtA system glycosyltransferase [Stellaceae bacterium]|nr:TIGR03087 family PEP-CTERM/XrtA system glycosyltransferase [Stellaceae bacterium]